MKKPLILTAPLIGGILVCIACADDEPSKTAQAPIDRQVKQQDPAVEAIRQAAADFAAALDRGDAKALAAHWTPDGIYIDEDGQRFVGRKAIQAEYELLFENTDELKLRLEIDSIRLINPQTAIEEGRAALTPQPPGAVRVMSSYTAVHVKQEGKWLMADVRDRRVELPPEPGQL